jgi:cobalt-precorrin 5A hydrolase/precorrin-3B C17-methyltransferase
MKKAIATTPTAAQKLQSLTQTAGATLWMPESLNTLERRTISLERFYTGSLKAHVASLWDQHRAFVFCLATGAVVRLIAPLLEDKSCDPAIVVVDEKGEFVISLCSGHQGKADQLARLVAHQLGAKPVLTGASAGLGLPGVDILGVPFGWQRGEGDWTGVSAAVARGEVVEVIQEAGSTLWQSHLPKGHPFHFGFPEYPATNQEDVPLPKARIWISPTQRKFSLESDLPIVQWHPRVLWVGIGCERGTSRQLIETAIQQVFQSNHLAENAIAGIATIDIKADEVGLVELCRDRNLPLQTFPAEFLRSVPVPNPSVVVDKEVGTPSVAEAAAIVAANSNLGAQSLAPLLVEKEIIRAENQSGAVTIAIAQSELEYTGRTGQLLLIGTGPGQLDQITPAAQTAVSCADAVIGYSLYIDLIVSFTTSGADCRSTTHYSGTPTGRTGN